MKRSYQDQLHVEGRYWMFGALFLFLLVPMIASLSTGVWPTIDTIFTRIFRNCNYLLASNNHRSFHIYTNVRYRFILFSIRDWEFNKY